MATLQEVQARITDAVPRPHATTVPLRDALGLVLAADVIAGEPVPPFANTAMDGYAVQAADTAGASDTAPVRLRVVGDLPAGHAPTVPVGRGEAIRIMTGAPIPAGADAIVMVERTERDGTDGVLVSHAATVGDHVRPAGGDVEEGDDVFAAGAVLTPAHVGVLASLGFTEVPVYARVRVGVISTGDELQEGPVVLAPGQIRDSNRPMLLGLVAESGAEAVDLGIGRDDEDTVTQLFRAAAASCDAIITSGGVSVGDYDVVKAVLGRLGTLEWWQVDIKPAKPLAFGHVDGTPIFGLPGNPVSSHVSFELFARPALRQMMGHADVQRPVVRAVAGEAMPRRADGKLYLDRVRVTYVDGAYVAVRSGAQASNVLSGLALANGLALLPDGTGPAAGDPIDVMLLS
ncbi:MAG: molybdopterin molybdotransferase MoeA [Acidimicrobiia bacterium]